MNGVITSSVLRFVLTAMSRRMTFYVLGAGASFRLVPLTPQLRSAIVSQYISIYPRAPVYPASAPPAPSQLFERVIGRVGMDSSGLYPRDFDFRELWLRNIPPETLDLLVHHGLSPPVDGVVPPQYAVFDVVGRPSTIFNFNLDGLATAYCLGHRVLEPHGRVDRPLLEACFEELLPASFWDLKSPLVTPLLPGPEPTTITGQRAYLAGRRLYSRSQALLLIGYSFGQWHGTHDDAESFEYFVDLLKTYPRPAAVLSPSPEELVDVLQQRLRSTRVYGLPV